MPNEEILARGYMTVDAMIAAGAVMSLPETSGIHLRDILGYELAEDLFLVHAQGGRPVSLEWMEELTRAERKRFSTLFGARILGSRSCDDGTEIVIDGVDPKQLEKFRTALDAHAQTEQQEGMSGITIR